MHSISHTLKVEVEGQPVPLVYTIFIVAETRLNTRIGTPPALFTTSPVFILVPSVVVVATEYIFDSRSPCGFKLCDLNVDPI